MRKMTLIATVIFLLAASGNAVARDFSERYDFMAGLDLGTYLYGVIPYANVDAGDEDASFYGIGGFGPWIGAHGTLFAKKFLVRFDLGYASQSGEAEIKYKDEDLDDAEFDYTMKIFRGSAGFGRPMFETSKVMPYWLLGASIAWMGFADEKADETASGTGFGPWGALGVDGAVYRTKDYSVIIGAQGRADLLFSIQPLQWEKDDQDVEIVMGYLPISFLVTAGIAF
ncbi:MAG: hypothetical protein P9M14_04325 [Candidatus Alcyoniella australis]|nr:hypothetical protein [Candidatus Alcyoniella australis]